MDVISTNVLFVVRMLCCGYTIQYLECIATMCSDTYIHYSVIY